MAAWYSDVFSSSAGATAPEKGYQCPPGRQNYPRMISKIDLSGAAAVAAMANADVVVMQPISPNDRIGELLLTVDALFNAATTFTVHLGLLKLTTANTFDSNVVAALFASAVNIDTTAVARVDEFTEATALVNLDRWKRAWELANITLSTDYTRGPAERWAIGLTLNISGAVSAGGTIQLETGILDA